MKRFFTRTMLMVTLLLPFLCHTQNTVNNPWLVWYPEISIGASDAPYSTFSINASTNSIARTFGNNIAGAGFCNSFGLGNDLRGYVYYGTTDNEIKIANPRSNSIIGTIPYATLLPLANITSWNPYSFYGFYISATGKHYVAVSGMSIELSSLGIAIFDVTDPAVVTLARNITFPSSLVCVQNNNAISAGAAATDMPGMALYQKAYTSAGTKLYCVIEDGTKAGSAVTLGLTGSNINNHPGVWVDISDPLNASPVINVHETYYTANTATGAIFTTSDYDLSGGHQIAYNKIQDQVFISSLSFNGILCFNAGGSSGNYNASRNIYKAGTGNISPVVTPTPNLGFHSIYVNRAGTAIYSGRESDYGIGRGEDRVLKFNIQPNTVTVTNRNESIVSPSFSVVQGIGTVDTDSVNVVKSANFTPDEQHLYTVTNNRFNYDIDKIFSIDPVTLSVIQPLQKQGGGNALFSFLCPHSYAFTLNDFSDAPASYGVAAHNLVNDNFIDDKLRIGSYIDGDTAAIPSAGFNSDDAARTGGSGMGLNADEDGITPAMKTAAMGLWTGMRSSYNNYTMNGIAVKNTSPTTATLAGWIDFNHDGVFTTAEGATVTVPIGSTAVNLSWTIPSNVTTGPVIMRLRLSTDAALTTAAPVIAMIDGEVEDHMFAANVPVSGHVFDDANGNTLYGTSGGPGSGETAAITGTPLFAYLVKDGIIIDTARVNAAGAYYFPAAPANASTAFVLIGTNSLATGTVSPAIFSISANPPSGWVYTGSSYGLVTNGGSGNLPVSLTTSTLINENFGLRTVMAAMPVKIVSYTAKLQGDNVVLKWTVTEEINVESYQLECSSNGIEFKTIDTKPAAGVGVYDAVHTEPVPGINYYRLTSYDKDGRISYREIRSVFINQGGKPVISPNPAKDNLRIKFPGSWVNKRIEISICNQAGQRLLVMPSIQATPLFTIDIKGYPSGVYVICLRNGQGNTICEKFTVYK